MKNKVVFGLVLTWLLLCSFDLGHGIKINLDKDPLELHGDSIAYKFTIEFEPKAVHKKGYLDLNIGLGDKFFRSIAFRGEKTDGMNDWIPEHSDEDVSKVPFKSGGKFVFAGKFKFHESMINEKLKVSIEIFGKKSNVDLIENIGNGLITTSLLMQDDDLPIYAKSGYQSFASKQLETIIYFPRGRYVPFKGEWNKESSLRVFELIDDIKKHERLRLDFIQVRSFCSVENEYRTGGDLCQDRAKYAADYVREKFELDYTDIRQYSGGEDWEGFKKYLNQGNGAYVDTILNVMRLYADPRMREEKIQELMKDEPEIEKMLAKLRRCHVIVYYKEQRLKDKEIFQYALTAPDSLTAAELIYASEMTIVEKDKRTILMNATRIYPDDWRAYNNLACMDLAKGENEKAKNYLEEAEKRKENPIIYANMASIYRRNGEDFKAKVIHKSLLGDSLINYNKSLLAIEDGAYEAALYLMGTMITYNKALTYTLMKKYDQALHTLQRIPTTIHTNYLRAIIAARQENKNEMLSRIELVVNENPSYSEEIKQNAEFWRYFDDPDFKRYTRQ